MIISKVVRDYKRHITAADYGNKPLLSSQNIAFPKVGSLQSRALRRLLPPGRMLSHRSFDNETRTYRLSGYIDNLREKGWPIINHDETAPTNDRVGRAANYTKYELFAEFTPELAQRIKAFCQAVDNFEGQPKEAA